VRMGEKSVTRRGRGWENMERVRKGKTKKGGGKGRGGGRDRRGNKKRKGELVLHGPPRGARKCPHELKSLQVSD